MKKYLRKIAILIVALSIMMTVPTADVSGMTSSPVSYHDVYVSSASLTKNARKKMQSVFNSARDKANDSVRYRIFLPSGTFYLNKALSIYSNTAVYMQKDTVFVRTGAFNMIRTDNANSTLGGYSAFRNITLSGGVFEGGGFNSCIIRMSHCKNVTMNGVTFNNVKDNHLVEVAAMDDFDVTGCTFSNLEKTYVNNSTCEALQLDLVHSFDHFPDAGVYDDTPCKNVTVSGCTFDSVYSGAGTRSGVIGIYFKNIKIINNTFRNINKTAIICANYKNSEIKSNTIWAQAGIEFRYMNNSNFSECFYAPYGTTPSNVSSNCNTDILGNVINVTNTSASGKGIGIRTKGRVLKKSHGDVPADDYTISNINVSYNKITTSKQCVGIELYGTNNSIAYGNIVTMTNTKKAEGCNAIAVSGSRGDNIIANTITGAPNNGISLFDKSTSIKLKSNSLVKCKKFGIRVEQGSNAVIYPNTFKKCKGKMSVNNVPMSELYKPQKVTVKRKDGKVRVSWKKKKGVSYYKVYRATKKDGEYVAVRNTKKDHFNDKSAKKGKKYYYCVKSVKKTAGSKIIGRNSKKVAVAKKTKAKAKTKVKAKAKTK